MNPVSAGYIYGTKINSATKFLRTLGPAYISIPPICHLSSLSLHARSRLHLHR